MLGLVFLVSGLGKVFERERTVQTVIAYNVLPEFLARIYGLLLPWGELALAGLLLIGLLTKSAAFLLALLLISFAIAVSVNLARGREMDCGCFGRVVREKISWRTLVRIAVLLALAINVRMGDRQYFALDGVLVSDSQTGVPSPPIIDFLPVLVTVVLFFLGFKLLGSVIQVLHDHQQLKATLLDGANTRVDE
jgi:uncharacterized membrane protein YphA (DoxX/SURF4 family)